MVFMISGFSRKQISISLLLERVLSVDSLLSALSNSFEMDMAILLTMFNMPVYWYYHSSNVLI